MKRINYLAALAVCAMTFTGCSNDEVISSVENPGVIGFNAMANKTGRAGEVTTNNISRFRVFGWSTDASAATSFVTLFDNVTVTKSGSDWTYENPRYWEASKDYYFVAVSSNNEVPAWTYTAPTTLPEGSTTANFNGAGSLTTSISGTNAERDLVFATYARNTDASISDATKVPFSFNHILSRIGVKFTNMIESDGYTLSISNVQISGLTNQASVEFGVDPTELVWTASEGTTVGVTTSVPSNNSLANNASTTSDYKFIIPGSQTISIQFNVDVRFNGQAYSKRTITGTIAAKEYKPGMSYMFNAPITIQNIIPGAKPIEFTVTEVAGWGNDESVEMTLPTE